MNRRSALTLLGASPILYVLAVRGQARPVPVVGFLNSASAATYSFNAAAFREGLREAGYVEGQNVVIEYRWADNDYNRLPGLASELASRKVAVIAATGDIVSARAALAATKTIPIVFTVGSDPVPFLMLPTITGSIPLDVI
jgi:putative ABC transport system substrate-binding protein